MKRTCIYWGNEGIGPVPHSSELQRKHVSTEKNRVLDECPVKLTIIRACLYWGDKGIGPVHQSSELWWEYVTSEEIGV